MQLFVGRRSDAMAHVSRKIKLMADALLYESM